MADEETKPNHQSANAPSKKKKKNKKRKQQPQPGDPDYKTPTQLRNARKRRKKKQDKQQQQQQQQQQQVASKKGTTGTGDLKFGSVPKLPYGSVNDPSLKYLSNPKAAPTVRNAIKFFREKTEAPAGTNHDQYFPVTCGPKLGWRTVARLAVRKTNENQLKIGLFVPGSHELLPVPDCPVHHRSINSLVKVLEETCNSLKVPAVDDDASNNSDNSFGLRYIAIAVDRSSAKQQLVLVWKEPVQEQNSSGKSSNSILEELVQKLVQMSREKTKKEIQLHSVWIHYNNTWKHSNSIFDRQGRWETKYASDRKKRKDGKEDIRYGAIRETMFPLPTKNTKDSADAMALDNIKVPLYFPPQVFRQANLDGFAKIILRIREWLYEQQSKEPAPPVSASPEKEKEIVTKEENDDAAPPKRKRRRGKRDTSNSNHGKEEEQQEHGQDDTHKPSSVVSTGKIRSIGHCLELYGGVGTIGLNLIDFFESLDSSDENPFNEACFNDSANGIKFLQETNGQKSFTWLDPSERSKITYTSKSASEVVVEQFESLKKARVVVVDPPRKGLDPPVLEALCSDYGNQQGEQQQQHLVYVSCGFDAFRRDYRALVEHSGIWTLDRAEGHILFPGSDAIETLAFFTRNK